MEKQQLPNSTLILVFGIVSIVTCCCYGIIGLIFGIIALVLASKATKLYVANPDLYSDYNNVKIGKNCYLQSNVIIRDFTTIGDNVTIHAGTVLGADAFYYKKRPEGFDKLRSGGRVVIEDNVDRALV